jgi:maltodextrin utilization protein YvdJ|tara:strand:- start:204 stop:518 length:315 start_codon:yes stop_codon:yes gene_type:complete
MKTLIMILLCSFVFTQEVCEGTCLSEEETKNLFNNVQELEFNLEKAKTLNLEYEDLMKDYETQIKLKDDMIELVKPKWYDNKYLWFFGGILITSGSIYLAGQLD